MSARDQGTVSLLTALLAERPESVPSDPREWEALLRLAAAHALLPALWVALRVAGVVAPVPRDARDLIEQRLGEDHDAPELLLQRAYEANADRQRTLVSSGTRTIERWTAAAVPVVPLKGLHTLFVGLWPDPVARAMVDVDILAAPGRAADAFEVALEGGFAPAPEPKGEHADHQLAALRDQDDAYLEVHETVLRRPWGRLLPASDVFAAAAVVDGPYGRHLVMHDTHAVVALIAHAQLQDETYPRLQIPVRGLYETDTWIKRRPSAIDWDEVERRFAGVGERGVLDAHLLALHRWFGTALPLRVSGAHGVRARVHDQSTVLALRFPAGQRTANYLRCLPRSFARNRLVALYGPDTGPMWVWRARARHVLNRLSARLKGR
jgi:hypothetical protein